MSDGAAVEVALKEWAIVCDLLAAGRMSFLLRKGGVHEDHGPGRFRLEEERFALFPAWEHEKLAWIKPDWLGGMRSEPVEEQPETLAIRAVAGVARAWVVPSREAFDRLEGLHPWAEPQVDLRFGYKPERPLYAVALRVTRLAEPRVIANRPAYAGCRSWVPLGGEAAVDPIGDPAVEPAELERRLAAIDAALG
ncbi:DUF1802 family protein [Phycisphaera mikurensis]|uniref:DUF1802 family protein n=1 Tax=Phycisphaera mikurensis (strain NBRC 102666 / KCTC 22515 / FYK2301M01) TaxID=1142394 RepID=I0IID2_PHYMF|nr:DUF1802 family protein [Phycisphaera mikurensis]MBB6442416.1 hypothetical protein [Phycisphaera mikurensis]BAM05020.1 hypothetical protein PSMK_28610 [Phycisphaera mikurensis NBRC 102666]